MFKNDGLPVQSCLKSEAMKDCGTAIMQCVTHAISCHVDEMFEITFCVNCTHISWLVQPFWEAFGVGSNHGKFVISL